MEPGRHCTACGGLLDGARPHPACTACGRVAYRDPKVGVGAVVRDDAGRLLLVRRGVHPGKGLWALPAGYVDAGEDPRAAAAREVAEETGLVVEVGEVVDVYTGTGGGASFFLAFRATVVGGVLAAADDALDARFFADDQLPELAFESTRAAAADAAVRPDDDVLASVMACEQRLLEPDVRADPDQLGELLHPDMVEHGTSGRRWDRDTLVAQLTADPGGSGSVTDLRPVRLAEDVVLLTYRVLGDLGSLRSSLWLRGNAGSWRLRFHQGTPSQG